MQCNSSLDLFKNKRQFDTFSPWWKSYICNSEWKTLHVVFWQHLQSRKVLQSLRIKKAITISKKINLLPKNGVDSKAGEMKTEWLVFNQHLRLE